MQGYAVESGLETVQEQKGKHVFCFTG